MLTQQMEGDAKRKDLRPTLRCRDSRESVILNANTPKEDSAGEKEAKRQRSNPGTPVSTPRRMPYDYDAVMGITRVGTREAEGFDEDLDSTEYHDAMTLQKNQFGRNKLMLIHKFRCQRVSKGVMVVHL